MSIVNRIRIGFALPLVLVVLIGAISYRTASQIPQASQWVEHTHEVISALRTLTTSVTDLVAAQRAQFAAGAEPDPRIRALNDAAEKQFVLFQDLVNDNPDQVRRTGELRTLVRRWSEIVPRAVEARRSGGLPAMMEVFKSENLADLGGRVRTLLKELEEEENRLLAQRHQRATESARRAIYAIGFGTAGAIVLGFLAVLWISQRITKPVTALTEGAKQVGNGVLDYRIRTDGQGELGALATTFNTMAAKLEAARIERREQAAVLRRERNLLRTLIDHLPEYVFIKDSEFRFVVVNQKLAKSRSETPEELVGKTDFDCFQDEFARRSRATDEDVIRSGKPLFDIEEQIVETTGERSWISVTKVPLFDADGNTNGLVGICRNVTERRIAEANILQLNSDLRKRASELQTVNGELEAFSYSVSHDLRAPLRHIDGYAELLVKRAGSTLDEKSRRYARIIGESAKEMGQLIDDLLVFSRMGRAEMRATRFPLEQLTHEVIEELGSNRQEVSWTVGPMPLVVGDRAMLRLVFVNLLSNALKYTRPSAAPQIEIGTCPKDSGELVVFVRDNGAGFDMEYVDKLFGVFQRLHSADEFEGTGIGLANVRRIIHRHGGRTWAQGAVGQGATFFFSLPLQESAA